MICAPRSAAASASGRISISSAMATRSSRRGRRTACASRTAAGSRSRRAPRRESRVQRRRQDRRRHSCLDRGDRRPATLARVRDAPRELLEARRLHERLRGEVEQPGADHAPSPPDLGDLGRVDLVLVQLGVLERGRLGVHLVLPLSHVGVRDDVQPLGIGGHDPVLDAVVHHLHEVAGTVRPAVVVAVLGLAGIARAARRARRRVHARGDRGEDGGEAVDDLRLAADHQAEAALEAPHAAARPDVDVVDALLAQGVRRGGCRRCSGCCRRR